MDTVQFIGAWVEELRPLSVGTLLRSGSEGHEGIELCVVVKSDPLLLKTVRAQDASQIGRVFQCKARKTRQ